MLLMSLVQKFVGESKGRQLSHNLLMIFYNLCPVTIYLSYLLFNLACELDRGKSTLVSRQIFFVVCLLHYIQKSLTVRVLQLIKELDLSKNRLELMCT